MKSILSLIICLLIALVVSAQSPEAMSYQAIIRNNNGDLVVSKVVGMKISIQKYVLGIPPTYQNVYVETHEPKTNENGLASIKVGQGTIANSVFADIDWSDGTFYIKTESVLQVAQMSHDLPAGRRSNFRVGGQEAILKSLKVTIPSV